MNPRRTSPALGIASAAPGAGRGTAVAAFAGGIGAIGSPVFGNTCVTLHHLTRSVGTTAHSAGLGGNLAQLPLGTSYQHCGGAGLPDESLRRSAAGGLVGPDLPVNALHGG